MSSFFHEIPWSGRVQLFRTFKTMLTGKRASLSAEEDKSQAPIEVCDSEGNTVVHLAAYYGCNPKTLKFLLTLFQTLYIN